MLKDLLEILDKNEYEFIYNCLEIVNSSKSGQSPYRFWYEDFRENCFERKGDIYEFGVYRGSSLIAFALLAKRLGSDKHFWGFDSFTGFPSFSPEDELENFSLNNGFSEELLTSHKLLIKLKSLDISVRSNNDDLKNKLKKLGKSGLFEDTSYEGLLKKIDILELDNISLVPGDFEETVPDHFDKFKPKIFSANLDCDLYAGYELCLPFIFNNLELGGYIHLDEYYSLKYPGPKIATDKFLKNNPNASLQKNLTRDSEFDRFFIRKKY